MSDFREMYEGIKEKQVIEILSALAKEKVSENGVRIDGDFFIFTYRGLQMYLENEVGNLGCRMHRLAQSDREERYIKENISLILSKESEPSEDFSKCLSYQKSNLPGDPEKTVRQALKIARMVAPFIPDMF